MEGFWDFNVCIEIWGGRVSGSGGSGLGVSAPAWDLGFRGVS